MIQFNLILVVFVGYLKYFSMKIVISNVPSSENCRWCRYLSVHLSRHLWAAKASSSASKLRADQQMAFRRKLKSNSTDEYHDR